MVSRSYRQALGLIVLAMAVAAPAVFAAPAIALSALPHSARSPANGTTITAVANASLPGASPPFTFTSRLLHLTSVTVVVDSQSTSGETGALSTNYRVGTVSLSPGQYSAPEATYTGSPTAAPWATIPGTYYWQIEAQEQHEEQICPEAEGPTFCFGRKYNVTYLSSVYTLVVAPKPPPPPPPLSLARGYTAVKGLIWDFTNRSAHRLKDRCTSANASTVACQASWASASHLSGSTLLYSGSFNLERREDGLHSSFVGQRAKYGCERRHGLRRCTVNVHWHLLTA